MSNVLDTLIALVPAPPGAAIARADGQSSSNKCERIELRDARALFESGDVLVAHAAFVAGRLGTRANVMLFDVLELFAFVRPGMPFVPSALGLARALGLPLPHTPDKSAATLHGIARTLLEEIAHWPQDVRESLSPLIGTLERAGWRWAPLLKQIVGETAQGSPIAGLEAWRSLKPWEDEAPVGQPGSQPVEPAEARARLQALVGVMRPEQGASPMPRRTPSARAIRRGAPGWRWWKRVPAPARPWDIWRRLRCGRRRMARASGSRPTPATCSARSCRR